MEKTLLHCAYCWNKKRADEMVSDAIWIYPFCKTCSQVNKELLSVQPERSKREDHGQD